MFDVNGAQRLAEQAEAKLIRYQSDPNCSAQLIQSAKKEASDAQASYQATCAAQLKVIAALEAKPQKPKHRTL